MGSSEQRLGLEKLMLVFSFFCVDFEFFDLEKCSYLKEAILQRVIDFDKNKVVNKISEKFIRKGQRSHLKIIFNIRSYLV